MQFKQLTVNNKFYIGETEYQKIPPKRISCCKVEYNAVNLDTNKKVTIQPQQEISRIHE